MYSRDRIRTIVRIFDTIADHFDLQGCFGRPDNTGGCVNICQRSNDKYVYCAIGCLLTESERKTNPEGTVNNLGIDMIANLHNRLGADYGLMDLHVDSREDFCGFLTSVQGFHDGFSSPIKVRGQDEESYERYKVSQFIMGIRRLADIFRDEEIFLEHSSESSRTTVQHFANNHLPPVGVNYVCNVFDAAVNFARLR